MNPTIIPLDENTSSRIIKRMMKEHSFSQEVAEAILNETLVYLHAVANSEGGFAPSAIVDIGWHTFILYTREYADYCQRAFGFFVHHNPTDRDGEVGRPISDTVTFMAEHGIVYDPKLWSMKSNCDSCDGVCTHPDPSTPCSPQKVVMAGCSVDNFCNGTPFCNGK